MNNTDYRAQLIETIERLSEYKTELFHDILNLVMQGEMSEWNNEVEIGEIEEFDIALFKGCSDINVRNFTCLLESINDAIETTSNLNNIQAKED